MKIAYARFNLPIELDINQASAKLLGIVHRIGMLHAMIKQGHEITIFTKIKPKHEFKLTEGWMSKIKYDLIGYPKDFDVLFIENAPCNTMFRYKLDNEDIPFIWRVFDIINNFKGKVFYYQHETRALSFPFAVQHQALGKGTNQWNLRVMGKKVDFWKDKKWCILTHYERHREFIRSINENRFCYFKYMNEPFNLTSRFMPHGYSLEVDKILKPKLQPENIVAYVGHERSKSRRSNFIKFLVSNKFRTTLYGDWKDIKQFENLDYKGKVCPAEVYDIYNNSLCSIQIGDDDYIKYGKITSRLYQIILSGCICLADKRIVGIEKYLGKNSLVANRTEMEEKVEQIKNMSYEERIKINEAQKKRLIQWEDIDFEEVFK